MNVEDEPPTPSLNLLASVSQSNQDKIIEPIFIEDGIASTFPRDSELSDLFRGQINNSLDLLASI